MLGACNLRSRCSRARAVVTVSRCCREIFFAGANFGATNFLELSARGATSSSVSLQLLYNGWHSRSFPWLFINLLLILAIRQPTRKKTPRSGTNHVNRRKQCQTEAALIRTSVNIVQQSSSSGISSLATLQETLGMVNSWIENANDQPSRLLRRQHCPALYTPRRRESFGMASRS
jgi:hypothetical protein